MVRAVGYVNPALVSIIDLREGREMGGGAEGVRAAQRLA